MILIYYMDPKKGRRNMRKIDVPTDTPTEFDLGDTAADIQRKREEREQSEKGGGRETTEVKEGGSQEGGNFTITHTEPSG